MGLHLNKLQLAQRQKQITDMYLKGISAEDIAERLEVSAQTVYNSIRKQRNEWQKETNLNMDLEFAKALRDADLLKETYWKAWEDSKSPMRANKRKVSQRTPTKLTENDEGALVADGSPQNVEETEETRQKEGNAQFLKGIEWCINFRVEMLGLKKINLDISGDFEFVIDA
jgi:predicted DNA-binding protein YlxM (UPF0122 family)